MEPTNTNTSNANPVVPPVPESQVQAPVQVSETQKASEAYLQNIDEESLNKPFYKEWTFWTLVVLVFVLISVVLWLLFPSLTNQIDAEVVITGDIAKVHVKKLTVPAGGFLVVQGDENGVPGPAVTKTPYLVADKYTDFQIPLVTDDPVSNTVYKEVAQSGVFYVSFYIYPTGEEFKIDENLKLAKGKFGKSLRIKFVNGKPKY